MSKNKTEKPKRKEQAQNSRRRSKILIQSFNAESGLDNEMQRRNVDKVLDTIMKLDPCVETIDTIQKVYRDGSRVLLQSDF